MNYDVETNQKSMHRRLDEVVASHAASSFMRPIPGHQLSIFARLQAIVANNQRPIVLDCGCGTGQSTQTLAATYPDYWVIGVDKSLHRLKRNHNFKSHHEHSMAVVGNMILLRAELADFIKLAYEHQLPIIKQYFLYPNPWPKASQLRRRWHGHPIFPTILSLSTVIEVRSNWQLYLDEWLYAAQLIGSWHGAVQEYKSEPPLSHFERKYWSSGEVTWRLALTCGSR